MGGTGLRLVLLAAGASRRMRGADKLLEPVEGVPLLRRQALAALASRVGPVAVTLPPEAGAREAALAGLPLERLRVADAASGMSASLRAAARWAEGHALMLAPADMPDLDAEDFAELASAFLGLGASGGAAEPPPATRPDGSAGRAAETGSVGGHQTVSGDRARSSGEKGAKRATGSTSEPGPEDATARVADTGADAGAGRNAAPLLRPMRATDATGTPGHPVIFPAWLLPEFETLTGDEGARRLLRAHPPRLFALPGRHALTDLDTPEDWAAWRDRRSSPPAGTR